MSEAIGSFTFVEIEGVPIDAANNKDVKIESRFGVNDVVVFIDTNNRGKQYQLRAFRDCVSVAAAKTLLKNYLAAKGSTVNLTVAGEQEEHQATIVDVDANLLRKIVTAQGGIESNPKAKLEVVFTMIGRDINAV